MLPYVNSDLCINCRQCANACPMGVLGGDGDYPVALPKRRCIGCGHCASICPRKAICFDSLSADSVYIDMPSDAIEALILSRRSVRKFRDCLPERSVIEWGLNRAEYAPSGKNVHATKWSVLWGREITDRVTEMVLSVCRATGSAPELLKLAAHGTNLITCNAPCLIIGWSPDDCLNPVIDTAVAMTTVDLLLNSKGLSTCWGGYLRQITAIGPELRAFLHIPEGCSMRCALMVGYPDGEVYRNIPYRPDADVTWIE